ncbi:MAG: sugar ABC transporter permease [Alphaproteobacteria bacterium]|nr:MAG: sugar ABC transporter permease [Alphaproteobacteria bacterium]
MARTIMALMLREMSTTYGKSAGGYIWAIVEPVLGIVLLSILFSFALRRPPIGETFPMFYATGYLPFVMFNSLSQKIARSVQFSKPLMAYPCVTFMDTLLARMILNMLTGVVVFIIVVVGIMVAYDMALWANLGALVTALALIMLLASGIGTLNCYMITSFPVYEQLWAIATRPLFLVSGIFFIFDAMPPVARDVLWYNPLIHIVGLTRKGIYPTYEGGYVSVTYVTLIGAIALFFGLLLLVRHFKMLMEA